MEELEGYLAEIDLVYDEVKKIASGKDEANVNRLLEKRKKEQAEKERKEKEEHEKKLKGRKGKGIAEDYINFCKFCFREFQIPIEKCTNCDHDTITRDDRIAELKEKLENYKQEKEGKKKRKLKWDNWKKTQQMKARQGPTNYNKWAYFEPSSDSEEEAGDDEPIVPKDDPNFKAMEADIEQRAKRRAENKKKANDCREKGNNYFKQGKFKPAVKKYTEAIEFTRDMLTCYTNRALAYIRLGQFDDAIPDCEKVLEYCEVFEDGYEQSATLCFKAFSRRAMSRRGKKEFDKAIHDLKQALELHPNDIEAQKLLKLTEEDLQLHEESKKVLESLDCSDDSQFITTLLDTLKNSKDAVLSKKDRQRLMKCLEKKDLVIVFKEHGGFEALVALLKSDYQTLELIKVCVNDKKFLEHFNAVAGMKQLVAMVREYCNPASELNIKIEHMCLVGQILSLGSENDFVRKDLTTNEDLVAIFEGFLQSTQEKKPDENLLMNLFTLMTNLCMGNAKYRQLFKSNIENTLARVRSYLIDYVKFTGLIESVLSFIGNICLDSIMRGKVWGDQQLVKLILVRYRSEVQQRNVGWETRVERIQAILINCLHSYHVADYPFIVKDLDIIDSLELSYSKSEDSIDTPIKMRSIGILSKVVRFKESIPRLLEHSKLTDILFTLLEAKYHHTKTIESTIRTLVFCFDSQEFVQVMMGREDASEIYEKIIGIMDCTNDELRANTASSVSRLSETCADIMPLFKKMIPKLIKIVQDKTGDLRKNCAICLAKLARHPDNLQLVRTLNGIQVLQSVANYIL